MIGILILTHGDFCQGIRDGSEMIVGSQSDIETLSLTEEGIDIFHQKVIKVMDEFREKYTYVIVLTDFKNATPYNEAYRYILSKNDNKFFLITGVNLPLLVELLIKRSNVNDIEVLIQDLIDVGKSAIEFSQCDFNETVGNANNDL